MRYSLIICIVLFCHMHSFSQDYPRDVQMDDIIIWNGFSQSWTYNHRLNRLGDYYDSEKRNIVHTAASGLGEDQASFQSYFTRLPAGIFEVEYGSVSFEMKGREGEKVSLDSIIYFPEGKGENHIVFLNGYDLVSLQKADKPEYFQVGVKEIESGNGIALSAALQANCSSLECEWFKHTIQYEFIVYYALLKFPENAGMNVTDHVIERGYAWDKKNELAVPTDSLYHFNLSGKGTAIIPIIKSIEFGLDEQQWMLEWGHYIGIKKYDTSNNMVKAEVGLYFKPWSEKMKKGSMFPKKSRFAIKKKGAVEMKMEVAFIQLDSEVFPESKTVEGEILWMGKNKSSLHPDAVLIMPSN